MIENREEIFPGLGCVFEMINGALMGCMDTSDSYR